MPENPNNRARHDQQTDWRKIREQHYAQAAEGTTYRYHFPYYVKIREAVLGIGFGGLCFSILKLLLYVATNLPVGVGPGGLMCGTLGFAFMCLAGVVAFAVIAVICLAFMALVARTVHSKPSWKIIAVMAGGMTGFLGGWAMIDQLYMVLWQDAVLQVLPGPFLATILCQFGAAWTTAPLEQHSETDPQQSPKPERQLRFNIRQLLIATAWVAGILTVVKLTDALGPWTLTIATAWMVYQTATMWLTILLVKKVRGYA